MDTIQILVAGLGLVWTGPNLNFEIFFPLKVLRIQLMFTFRKKYDLSNREVYGDTNEYFKYVKVKLNCAKYLSPSSNTWKLNKIPKRLRLSPLAWVISFCLA